MRRVFLLLTAGALLVACNKDDNQPQTTTIYFADKIVETTLPEMGTQTLTTEHLYEYASLQYGLVKKHTAIVRSGVITGTTTVEETLYNGTSPSETVVTVDNIKKRVVKYDQYDGRGRLLQKTTLNEGAPNLPIIEKYAYRYDNGLTLQEHSRAEKMATGETVYKVATYTYGQNEIEVKGSVYTVTNGSTSSATVVSVDKYLVESVYGTSFIRKHTRTANGETRECVFRYDGRTNPKFLLSSDRLTKPEVFLQKDYARSNVVKEEVTYPNISGRDYTEETSYEYFKMEYPLNAVTKRGGNTVKTKSFTY
nr:hypothetical protein [uncultured Capnocytophaga sp.]